MITNQVNGTIKYQYKDFQLELSKADDRTKNVKFDCSALTGEVSLSVPNQSGAILTDQSSVVNATGLRTQSGAVAVSASVAPQAGQVLVASAGNEAEWKNLPFNDLDDVEITAPANNQVVVYDSATSKWKNAAVPVQSIPDSYVFRSNASFTQNVGDWWSFPTVTAPYTDKNSDMSDGITFSAPIKGVYQFTVRVDVQCPAPTHLSLTLHNVGTNSSMASVRSNPNAAADSDNNQCTVTLTALAYLEQSESVRVRHTTETGGPTLSCAKAEFQASLVRSTA